MKGRLALTKTSNASTTLAESWFGYDSTGRVNSVGSCAPRVCPVNGAAWSILGFTFNYDGTLATLSDPDVPDTLTYTRNSIGQLTGLTSSLHNSNLPQTLVSNAKYNAFGAVVSDTSVDGYSETFGYNNMGRRTSFSAGSLYSFSLGYNSAGSVSSIADSQMGSWTFGYDPYFFGRLTSATCSANCPNGWGALSWTYDEYGNRWKQIVTSGQGPQPSYSFDTHNRITGSGVVYDNAGNMLNDGLGDTYTYDANSRLVNAQGFAYVFDALGNRVASTNLSSGWETDYVYAGVALVHRNDANANGWGFESGFGSYYGRNSSHFYKNYTDQVSSERVQTQYSTSGSTVNESCQNLPFGDAFPCQHPQGGYGGDAYYFAALSTDPVGNDNHAVAREYSGTQGRWESPDPAGIAAVDPSNPQSWNKYAYVMNNPLRNIDPTGLAECTMDGVDAPCAMVFASLQNDGAAACPNNNCSAQFIRGQWQNFGAWADGSSGYMPMSLAGFSTLDAANALAIVNAAAPKVGKPVDPASLTGRGAAAYGLLTDPNGLNIAPGDITIYQNDRGEFEAVLSTQGFDTLISGLDSNPGDAFLHYPYTNGARDFNPTDSLHAIWLDFNLTNYVGGSGV